MTAATISARLPEVDAYIARAQPFARPILTHLRVAIHRVLPEVTEAIKWGMPFFLVRGVIFANMAGHKAHASFGLWGREVVSQLEAEGVASGGNMGSFGRLTSVADLPPAESLDRYLLAAAALIQKGTRTRSIQRVAKPSRTEPELPEAFARALSGNSAASEQFGNMSPSCRREYAAWIAEARREDTRNKRIATALEWISEGKGRNWKYERPAGA